MAKRTLLLLGGSAAQVAAIDKASELGYRTVLCDYLPDNPGQFHADSFHQVSTTDRDSVLAVAYEESVDGVVAYASDPAAPTAAYVADQLRLPGNSVECVEDFCDKARFRSFLKSYRFNAPDFLSIDSETGIETAAQLAGSIGFPLVLKPVDASGSKGVSVVRVADGLAAAVRRARESSHSGDIIAEGYIGDAGSRALEAEVFVVDGRVVSWGIMESVRGHGINPLVPTISIHPPRVSETESDLVKAEIQRMVNCSGFRCGPMNIELVLDSKRKVWFVDVGPRNGGNMLAEFFSCVSGRDVVAATIGAAMGRTDLLQVDYPGNNESRWVQHILGSPRPGRFLGLRGGYPAIGELVNLNMYYSVGDQVPAFNDAGGAIGIAFLRFRPDATDEEIVQSIDDAVVVE